MFSAPVLRSSVLLAVVCAGMCAGCTVPDWDYRKARPIDQTTFAPAARAPTPAQVAAARLPPLPLLTIRMGEDDSWRNALPAAIDAAQSRKPDAQYDVLAVIPTAAPPDAQDKASRQGEADVREVANALGQAGVVPDRIHLGFSGDPGNPPREVVVFVR